MKDTDMVQEQMYDVLNQDGLQPPIAQVSLASCYFKHFLCWELISEISKDKN